MADRKISELNTLDTSANDDVVVIVDTSETDETIKTKQQTKLNLLKEINEKADDHIVDVANPHGVTKSQVGLGSVPNIDTTTAVAQTHTHANKSTLDAIQEALTTALKAAYDAAVTWISTNGTAILNHISNTSNPHGVTKTQVGLSNVDNTSDANKPVSTAQQTALNLKEDLSNKENTTINTSTTKYPTVNLLKTGLDTKANASHSHAISDVTGLQTALDAKADDTDLANYIPTSEKGANNGVAELDSGGKVPSSQLPSYVDDVETYANFAALPVTGETGKIYITEDENKTYRWSGSAYAEISASLALGETSSTAYRGDRGKAAYDHSQLTTGNPHNVTKAEVGLGNADNTSDANKPVSTAQQTALDLKVDKVTGYALSQNDFTNTLKTKLDGIEAGAEVNNINDTNAADLTDGGDTTLHTHDARYYTESEVDTALAGKQNTIGYTPENQANKENTTIDTSTTKYPTVNLLKTGLDTKALKAQTSGFPFNIVGTITDRAFKYINIPIGFSITKITTRSTSGTGTLTVSINGTPLGGTANSVSSTEQSQTHGSANAVAIGDDIEFTFSSTASLEDCWITVELTKTLA